MNTETDRDPADIVDALDLLDVLLAELPPDRLRDIAATIHRKRYRDHRGSILHTVAVKCRKGVGVRTARLSARQEMRQTVGPTTLLVLTADALSLVFDDIVGGEGAADAVRWMAAEVVGDGVDVDDLIAAAVPFVVRLVELPEPLAGSD